MLVVCGSCMVVASSLRHGCMEVVWRFQRDFVVFQSQVARYALSGRSITSQSVRSNFFICVRRASSTHASAGVLCIFSFRV